MTKRKLSLYLFIFFVMILILILLKEYKRPVTTGRLVQGVVLNLGSSGISSTLGESTSGNLVILSRYFRGLPIHTT